MNKHSKNLQKKSSFPSINTTLRVGLVLKVFEYNITPPKIKFLIILGIGTYLEEMHVFYVLINSKLNSVVNHNQELQTHQVLIKYRDHSFLDHDSYVDCSKERTKFFSELQATIKNRPDSIVGELTRDQLMPFINTIKHSNLFSGKIKKRYGFYD